MKIKGYRLELSLNLREMEALDTYGSPIMQGMEIPNDVRWTTTPNQMVIQDYIDLGEKDFQGVLAVLSLVHGTVEQIKSL